MTRACVLLALVVFLLHVEEIWCSNESMMLLNSINRLKSRVGQIEERTSDEIDDAKTALRIELAEELREMFADVIGEGGSSDLLTLKQLSSQTRHLQRSNHQMKKKVHGLESTIVHLRHELDAHVGAERKLVRRSEEIAVCSEFIVDSKLLERQLGESRETYRLEIAARDEELSTLRDELQKLNESFYSCNDNELNSSNHSSDINIVAVKDKEIQSLRDQLQHLNQSRHGGNRKVTASPADHVIQTSVVEALKTTVKPEGGNRRKYHYSVGSVGRRFTLAFFPEYLNPPQRTIYNFLYVSSTEAGFCQVSYHDGSRKTTQITMVPGEVVEKGLPDITQVSNIGTGVEPKAIYVNCSVDVTLHGYNRLAYQNDVAEPFLVLPDHLLFHQYMVPSVDKSAFIGVVALQSHTVVSLRLRSTCSYRYKSKTYASRDNINVTLQYGDVFRLGGTSDSSSDKCDFGGTMVFSNTPISVFSGALYYRLTGGKSVGHLITHLLHRNGFTNNIIIPSVKRGKHHSMSIRTMAKQENTVVNITSEGNSRVWYVNKFLQKYGYVDLTFQPEVNVVIESSAPVMTTQRVVYKNGGGSLTTIPGITQYSNNLLIRGFKAYKTVAPEVTVVTETNATHDLLVNGRAPPNIQWTNLSSLPYSVGRFKINDRDTYNVSGSSPMMVRVDEEIGMQSFSFIAGYRINPFSTENVKSAVSLLCKEWGWEVRVDLDKLPVEESDIPHLYLTTDNCVGTLQGREIFLNYSYTDCKTLTRTIEGRLVYKNTLLFESPSSESIIEEQMWHLNLKCSMPVNNSDSVHFHPGFYGDGLGELAGTITESPVHVTLFKDSGHENEVTGSAVKADIGDVLYVKVTTDNNNIMVVHSCHVHLDHNDTATYPLIQNGCAVKPRTKNLVSLNKITSFTFEVFNIRNERDGIYVTCQATFCDPMISDECQPACKNP